jgi:phage repressor protein C with HTH and peptisase S24 domain
VCSETSFQDQLRQLAAGRTIAVPADGTSMRPRIEPGQIIHISPVQPSTVLVDDIVLVRWKRGTFIAHLVMDIRDGRYLIGNTWGKKNGWVEADDILGIVTDVRDADECNP